MESSYQSENIKRYKENPNELLETGKPVKIKLKKSLDIHPGNIVLTYNSKDYTYILDLIKQLNKQSVKIKVFDTRQRMLNLVIDKIYYVEVVDTKVFIYDHENSYEYKGKFKELYEILQNFSFTQVSKNTIVNKEHISLIKILPQCRRGILLDNGESIIVNRKYKHNIQL